MAGLTTVIFFGDSMRISVGESALGAFATPTLTPIDFSTSGGGRGGGGGVNCVAVLTAALPGFGGKYLNTVAGVGNSMVVLFVLPSSL